MIDKDFFAHETYTGELTLNGYTTNALVAIAYDAKVRYNYGVDDIKKYLFHSLMGDQIDEIMADASDSDSVDEKVTTAKRASRRKGSRNGATEQ